MNLAGCRILLGLLVGTAVSGCRVVSSSPPTPAAVATNASEVQVLDRLYFGRNIPTGGQVSDAEWARFVAEVITPRFPAGLTIFQGEGQWRGNDGQIDREPSMIIEITHADTPGNDRAVADIAKAYKQRFSQEAVLRIRQPAAMTLY